MLTYSPSTRYRLLALVSPRMGNRPEGPATGWVRGLPLVFSQGGQDRRCNQATTHATYGLQRLDLQLQTASKPPRHSRQATPTTSHNIPKIAREFNLSRAGTAAAPACIVAVPRKMRGQLRVSDTKEKRRSACALVRRLLCSALMGQYIALIGPFALDDHRQFVAQHVGRTSFDFGNNA
jgi:hypothetical protein